MRPSLILVVTCFVQFSSTAVNWYVDDSTVPESIPELMYKQYNSDEDIEKAVFWAYKSQYDVITEHNGHVYDPESPLGYFKDSLILPKICRVSLISSDIIFENNTINGLSNYNSNTIVIKWSQDKVSTEATWKEIQVMGEYKYFDGWRYLKGDYQIAVEDIKYQADSPLSRNIELYPSSASAATISYGSFRTFFTGNHLVPGEVLEATRYFLEKVTFRYIADHVMETMRNNVTFAIRAAVQPYVLYKNRSDPHFPSVTGRLDNGQDFVISDPFMDGLQNAIQKVMAVRSDTNVGAVILFSENTLHNVSGTFNLLVMQQQGTTVIEFTIDRISLSVTYDVLKPNCYCSTVVQLYGMTAWPKNGNGDKNMYQQVAAAFIKTVKDHLSVGTCAAIVKMNKYGRNPYCPQYLLK